MGVTKVEDSCPVSQSMSLTLTASQGVKTTDFIDDIIEKHMKHILINVDNESAIELTKNPTFHSHSKNIKICYHYVWKCI